MPETGIYKRKKESKKTHSLKKKRNCSRKKELGQENTLSTKKVTKKKRENFLFSWSSSRTLSWPSSFFLERVRVFLFSYFLVFFTIFKRNNQRPFPGNSKEKKCSKEPKAFSEDNNHYCPSERTDGRTNIYSWGGHL